ncbi:hypothetical protein [Kitasatospora sp. NPDC057198]|uniref:hypothetical protein n=1 Tax=Kitasatospora sp. NPDC057198 TaxID=3346046 RepID=UPI0036391937
MTARQQVEPEPEPELALGYCLRCGSYTRGEYVGQINSYAEAIRNHPGCQLDDRPVLQHRTDR